MPTSNVTPLNREQRRKLEKKGNVTKREELRTRIQKLIEERELTDRINAGELNDHLLDSIIQNGDEDNLDTILDEYLSFLYQNDPANEAEMRLRLAGQDLVGFAFDQLKETTDKNGQVFAQTAASDVTIEVKGNVPLDQMTMHNMKLGGVDFDKFPHAGYGVKVTVSLSYNDATLEAIKTFSEEEYEKNAAK